MLKKIALIDSDRAFTDAAQRSLRADFFDTDVFNDAPSFSRMIAHTSWDVAVISMKMPGMDGIEIIRALHRRSDTPVLMTLDARTSKNEIDEIFALRAGADDCLMKPVSPHILVERIRAILRRYDITNAQNKSKKNDKPIGNVIDDGELRMEEERHFCSWKGQSLHLTNTEFKVMQELAIRPGYIKNRARLIEAAYENGANVDEGTMASHIKRLRLKFKAADDGFDRIETIYSAGYRYRDASADRARKISGKTALSGRLAPALTV